MKTLKNLFLVSLFSLLFLGISCRANDPVGCSFTVELDEEVTDLTNAASVYAQDPTPTNCEAYKQAYRNYLDEAEKLDNCVLGADRTAYRQAIDDAQASLDALTC
ncbi:MAG: hypothetical protein AAFR87_31595 [Bacteroidota bacterium]